MPAVGAEVMGHKRRAKRTHEELAKNLPIEEIIRHTENKVCEKCGSEKVVIGEEKSPG